MDVLALGDYILLKEEQPPLPQCKDEGLENEDACFNGKSTHPQALLNKLRHVFRFDFLPVAEQLRREGVVLRAPPQHLPSNWREFPWKKASREMFEYQAALDTTDPDPHAFTEALLQHWEARTAQALRPVIQEIVALGLKYPPSETLAEEVSESMYAMF